MFSSNPPIAQIRDSELHFTYVRSDHDSETVKNEFQRALANVKNMLERIEGQVEPWNKSLKEKAMGMINARREKLLKDQGMLTSLGYPLKKRGDAPRTYVTPTVRRKADISRPTASEAPYVSEPEISMEEYENILSIISNMVR